jgi:hypothetical protein
VARDFFTNNRTDQAPPGGRKINCPPDRVPAGQTHLPKLAAQRPHMWHPHLQRAELFEQPCHVEETRLQVIGQAIKLALRGGDELDGPASHGRTVLYIVFGIAVQPAASAVVPILADQVGAVVLQRPLLLGADALHQRELLFALQLGGASEDLAQLLLQGMARSSALSFNDETTCSSRLRTIIGAMASDPEILQRSRPHLRSAAGRVNRSLTAPGCSRFRDRTCEPLHRHGPPTSPRVGHLTAT